MVGPSARASWDVSFRAHSPSSSAKRAKSVCAALVGVVGLYVAWSESAGVGYFESARLPHALPLSSSLSTQDEAIGTLPGAVAPVNSGPVRAVHARRVGRCCECV